MRRAVALLFACAVALTLAHGRAEAAARPAPAWAGTCGLPAASPIWVDYGWPDLSPLFGRPGVVVTGAGGFASQMRAAGAGIVYFDLYLNKRVGQPNTPADPSTIVDKANKLFDYVVQQTGCPTPTIVENELFGAGLVTPWSDTNAQYRQNVLAFLQQLAARGAHPVLLVNSTPYTAGDAGTWWQQVAASSDIVREDYVPATQTWKLGPIVGNRNLRQVYRRSIQDLVSIAIPPQRLGIMISFATTRNVGGRNGLEPTSAWLQVTKWQALAAQTVAAETGVGSIWSWGWATWTDSERDADKPLAACVWLWTRNPSLCDVANQVPSDFDTSRSEGQIRLPAGVQCSVGRRTITNGAISALQQLTGDRETAFSALYERLVESQYAVVPTAKVLAAERALIAEHFGGSRGAYLAALASAHVSLTLARGVLGDELRRADVEATLPASLPTSADVARFYQSYPELLVRPVTAKLELSWLGNEKQGLILSATAPDQLFEGGARTVWTPTGKVRIVPNGDAVPLGAVPLDQARPAIAAALRSFRRGEAFERWTEGRQTASLATTVCARDDVPAPGAVELTTFVPFLQLSL